MLRHMTINNIYRLKNIGLPVMQSIEDLAKHARLSIEKIRYLSVRTEFIYLTYELPKTNGKTREIAQPSRELKAIQSWILRNILDKLSPSIYSKGFEKGTSILDNAFPHIGSTFVLTIDLENFFPTVKASKVFTLFKSVGYNKEMCVLLTNLCVFKGGLPQGAPTSPKLSNLICDKLDSRINGYAGPKGIVYTRYADDITLSANNIQKLQKAKDFIGTIISDENFKINKSKTKLCGTKRQKIITGLVLSESSAGIGRVKLREIRAKIHHAFVGKHNEFDHINGLLSFTYSVDKSSYKKLYRFIDKMNKDYPDSLAVLELHKNLLKKQLQ